MLRFAEETDLLDWYFIWFLRLDSFCFYQCVYFCKKSLFQVECFEGSMYVGFDLRHRRFWKCMSVSYVYCNRCKCINCSLENVVHMKDVDVAWRLIDVVREGQKLKKTTSNNYKLMLLSLPGFESICPNSWVLVTATIGLKTKQKKAFTTFFAEDT